MNLTRHFVVSMLMAFAVRHPTNGQLVDQFNTLLSQPGWQYMEISVSKKYKGKGKQLKLKDNVIVEDDIFIPASELLEVNIPGDRAVSSRNLTKKFKQILIVLQCKYAEVTVVYRLLFKNLIETCRLELILSSTLMFYKCFDLVLSKASSISVTFRYMRDALEFFEAMTPNMYFSYCVVQKSLTDLEAFTRQVSEGTYHSLNKYQFNARQFFVAVKQELDRFLRNFIELTRKSSNFLTNFCLTPLQVNTPEILTDNFVEKAMSKISSLPSEETIVDYIGHEIDAFSGHVIKRWFYRLGFIYVSTENSEKVTFNKDILS